MKTIFEIFEHNSGYYSIVLSVDKVARFPLFGGDSAWEDCYDLELMNDILKIFNEFYDCLKNETVGEDDNEQAMETLLTECIYSGFNLEFEGHVYPCNLQRLKSELITFLDEII